jgi:transposase InsO family protein
MLRKSAFFPYMSTEVKDFVDSCLACQQKLPQAPDKPHGFTTEAPFPWATLHIDFVGPLPPGTRTGAKWLLTACCGFSKWIEAFPLVAATAEATVVTLRTEIFARFGVPHRIHSDMGKQFESKSYTDISKLLGIRITGTTPYNPKSNTQVERIHKDLHGNLQGLIGNDFTMWEELLPQAPFSIRTDICRTTGLAPYQILFGRNISAPLDLIFGNPEESFTSSDLTDKKQYVRALRQRIDQAAAFAR